MKTAFCLDLDGTITREELLPLIAQEAGISEEMRILTEATLKGAISFKRSFEFRCRLLAEIPISRVRDVVKDVVIDADIEAFIDQNRDRCFIVTGNLDVWIEPLVRRLGCAAYSSKASHVTDKLIAVEEVLDKAHAVQAIRNSFDRVIAVGDGMNDASMFEVADIGIAYGGVHEPVPALIDVADYVVTDGRALCRLLNTL